MGQILYCNQRVVAMTTAVHAGHCECKFVVCQSTDTLLTITCVSFSWTAYVPSGVKESVCLRVNLTCVSGKEHVSAELNMPECQCLSKQDGVCVCVCV